jgi:hypothetical protein
MRKVLVDASGGEDKGFSAPVTSVIKQDSPGIFLAYDRSLGLMGR